MRHFCHRPTGNTCHKQIQLLSPYTVYIQQQQQQQEKQEQEQQQEEEEEEQQQLMYVWKRRPDNRCDKSLRERARRQACFGCFETVQLSSMECLQCEKGHA